jgi:hypothetical protein
MFVVVVINTFQQPVYFINSFILLGKVEVGAESKLEIMFAQGVFG